MNRNILIVMGGGFIVALIVAIIVQASFSSKKEGMVEVAVATKALKTGDDVSDSNFKWAEWPKDAVYEGVVVRESKKKITEMAEGKIRRDLNAGEPLMQAYVMVAGKGNILATAMEPGMRAIAIKVKPESMVGGFISPGDRVDVILTYQIKLSGDAQTEAADKVSRHASQTVLENVKILAIDQSARREDDKAKVGRTVTLEVNRAGAERMALAGQMGDLSLVLRAFGDEEVANAKTKEFTTDVEVSSILQELGKIKKSSGGKSNIVRVYNGQTIENVTVRQ
ncbi:MAG: Flp pilus assembly protein CpaB [Pseudobdellovibrionaceae bacterium]